MHCLFYSIFHLISKCVCMDIRNFEFSRSCNGSFPLFFFLFWIIYLISVFPNKKSNTTAYMFQLHCTHWVWLIERVEEFVSSMENELNSISTEHWWSQNNFQQKVDKKRKKARTKHQCLEGCTKQVLSHFIHFKYVEDRRIKEVGP